MSDWSIKIPYRDRDDLVLDAITAARDSQLAEHEVQVVDVLARDALKRGITTVGELIDELGRLDRSGTRRRLDWAREQAGLETATSIDVAREQRRIDRRFEADDIPGPPRWCPLQACHARLLSLAHWARGQRGGGFGGEMVLPSAPRSSAAG